MEDDDMCEDHAYPGNETDAAKRAHHNILEKKRREVNNDKFSELRDLLPDAQGRKLSRKEILEYTTHFVQTALQKRKYLVEEIADLKKQNKFMAEQIKALEDKATGNYVGVSSILNSDLNSSKPARRAQEVDSKSVTSYDAGGSKDRRRKKIKVASMSKWFPE